MSVEPPPRWVLGWVEQMLLGAGFWNEWLAEVEDAWADATEHGDLVLTSWWRSPAENARVGGMTFSQHLVGTAFDVVTDDKLTAGDAFERRGFTVVDEGDHLHVQVLPARYLEWRFGGR